MPFCPCKLKCAGDQIQVGLPIVEFHPGRVGFVAQSQVQGQSRSNVPVVLTVSCKQPGELVPDKTGADADTSGFRIAEEEIGSRVAGEIGVTVHEGPKRISPYSPVLPV